MALNCAILSYNGTVYFGFSGDVKAAPDLRRLETLLGASFTELRDATGIKPPQKKRVRPRRRVAAAAARLAKIVTTPVPTATIVKQKEPKREAAPAPTSETEHPQRELIVA